MAETILSPGVFIQENDGTFSAQGTIRTGAVIIGPTNKGAAFVPTVITKGMNEFNAKFGENTTATYVPQTVNQYLKNAGSVMVLRVLGNGGFGFNVARGLAAIYDSGSNRILSVLYPSKNSATADLRLSAIAPSEPVVSGSFNLALSGSNFATAYEVSASMNPSDPQYITRVLGENADNSKSGSAYVDKGYVWLNWRTLQAASSGSTIRMISSSATINFSSSDATVTEGYDHAVTPWITSGNSNKKLFKIHHRGDGFDTNKDVYVSITDLLEPDDINGEPQYSTFTVLVRKVGDTDQRPSIVDSFTRVNLDPSSADYIGRRIGDRYLAYNSTLDKVLSNGEFNNQSDYIRVEVADEVAEASLSPNLSPRGFERPIAPIGGFAGISVPSASYRELQELSGFYNSNAFLGFDLSEPDNLNYLNPTPTVDGAYVYATDQVVFNVDTLMGHPSSSYTGSLSASVDQAGVSGPKSSQVQFSVLLQGGTDGIDYARIRKTGEDITSANAFGYDLSSTSAAGAQAYAKAANILSNREAYDFNVVAIPGVIHQYHSVVNLNMLNMVENRKDAIMALDLVGVNGKVTEATAQAAGLDSSYAASYYPWVKMTDIGTGVPKFFPPAVVIPGVFSRTDRISAPWFAPAGLIRGGLPGVIEAKNPLSSSERDTLYQGRVNPIATFPGQGIVVYGQKTLQAATSALDRVKVRRTVIDLRKFVDVESRQFVFDNNVENTRRRWLNVVNPYLQSVKDREGLYAYKVVMDETNNTADVIDRLELVGAIFIQPTRAAEFIKIDFNISPTGAQL